MYTVCLNETKQFQEISSEIKTGNKPWDLSCSWSGKAICFNNSWSVAGCTPQLITYFVNVSLTGNYDDPEQCGFLNVLEIMAGVHVICQQSRP